MVCCYFKNRMDVFSDERQKWHRDSCSSAEAYHLSDPCSVGEWYLVSLFLRISCQVQLCLRPALDHLFSFLLWDEEVPGVMWLLEGENHVNYLEQVVQLLWLQGDITCGLCLVGSIGTCSMCGKAWRRHRRAPAVSRCRWTSGPASAFFQVEIHSPLFTLSNQNMLSAAFSRDKPWIFGTSIKHLSELKNQSA